MYLNWKFERSSGYAGWRCTRCGEWIYDGEPFDCDCGKIDMKPLRDLIDSIPIEDLQKFLLNVYKSEVETP